MTEEEFKDALKKFCVDNGYEIAGTCEHEGIFGEITIRKIGDNPNDGWRDWDGNKFNFLSY